MNELLIHYWQLPKELFIDLKDELHEQLCNTIKNKLNSRFKNCFYEILKCPKYHAQRLFNKEIRFRIGEVEILRDFAGISKEETESNLETLGNHEDGTIIKNPRLPFHLKDIIYVASHLMFDGSYREKKGNYFYVHETSLLEYHKLRLNNFGEVPINFIENEEQLYFSYTLAFIASKLLEIPDFRSLKVTLSEKFKTLVKENKELIDEFIKAMITDEGVVEDKIKIELGDNKKLVDDINEIVSIHYKLNEIWSRTRSIDFKEFSKSYNNTKSWNIEFSTSSFTPLYEQIKQLPIDYKQKSFELLYKRKNREWYKRKQNETKKLIIKSLLEKPKSVLDLAYELCIKNGTIIAHLKGAKTYSKSLIDLGIVNKIEERLLNKGGFTKANIYGIINKEKAMEYLKN